MNSSKLVHLSRLHPHGSIPHIVTHFPSETDDDDNDENKEEGNIATQGAKSTEEMSPSPPPPFNSNAVVRVKNNTTSEPLSVILDCDPGVDDALALALCLSAHVMEKIVLHAVTITFGNSDNVKLLARNAMCVMHYIERHRKGGSTSTLEENDDESASSQDPSQKPLLEEEPDPERVNFEKDIPVLIGATGPLRGKFLGKLGMKVHGETDALGNKADKYFSEMEVYQYLNGRYLMEQIEQEEREETSAQQSPKEQEHKHKWDFPTQHAADYLVDQVKHFPSGQFTIVCTGPLTNLALAIQRGLQVEKVKQVILMGGAFETRGNVTPFAEANIHNDAYAARIVFQAGFKSLHVVPINATRGVRMTKHNFLPRLKQEAGWIGKMLSDITEHYVSILQKWEHDSIPLHDATTIMYLLFPELFSGEDHYVDVETKGELTAGATVLDRYGHYGQNAPNARIIFSCVDEEKYKELFLNMIRELSDGAKQY